MELGSVGSRTPSSCMSCRLRLLPCGEPTTNTNSAFASISASFASLSTALCTATWLRLRIRLASIFAALISASALSLPVTMATRPTLWLPGSAPPPTVQTPIHTSVAVNNVSNVFAGLWKRANTESLLVYSAHSVCRPQLSAHGEAVNKSNCAPKQGVSCHLERGFRPKIRCFDGVGLIFSHARSVPDTLKLNRLFCPAPNRRHSASATCLPATLAAWGNDPPIATPPR